MLKIDLHSDAERFLEALPEKHQRQVSKKIVELAEGQAAIRSKLLKGFEPLRRVRSGMYRIVYFLEKDVVKVAAIDRRNDDKVYRGVVRKFKKS